VITVTIHHRVPFRHPPGLRVPPAGVVRPGHAISSHSGAPAWRAGQRVGLVGGRRCRQHGRCLCLDPPRPGSDPRHARPRWIPDRRLRVREQQIRERRDYLVDDVPASSGAAFTPRRRAVHWPSEASRPAYLFGDAGPAPSSVHHLRLVLRIRLAQYKRHPGPRPSKPSSEGPRTASPHTTRPSFSVPGTSTAWRMVRGGCRGHRPLEAARNLQPAALRAGIATCILVRPGVTTSTSGARRWWTPCRGCRGGWASRPNRPASRRGARHRDQAIHLVCPVTCRCLRSGPTVVSNGRRARVGETEGGWGR